MTPDELKALVRSVPDFPAPGVLFRDITTLISHGEGLRDAVGHLAERARHGGAQAIAGMEARGFIFGAAVAIELGVGFLPVRKPGKLPSPPSGSITTSNMAPTGWRSIPLRSRPDSGSRSSMI